MSRALPLNHRAFDSRATPTSGAFTMKARRALFGLTLAALGLAGCGHSGGLGVEARAVTTQKPGHVAAYLEVSEDGKPARGLSARDFTVYENDLALSYERTQQVLLDKTRVAAHHTLVLLDISDANNPETAREIHDSLWFLLERVQKTQAVSVYVFDGGPRIRLLADFRQKDEPRPVLPARFVVKSRDASRNLNGAIVLAHEELDRRLARSGKSLQFGTLVVFSGGPDLAGRVDRATALNKLRQSPHRILGVSFGNGEDAVRAFAKDGYFDAHSAPVVSLAFEDLAHHVEALYDREYVLAYCSPARAGTRRLRIEARVTGDRGEEKTGEFSSSFNADGFEGRCDPERAPRFDVAAAR